MSEAAGCPWPRAQLEALFQARFEHGSAPALAAEVTRPGHPPARALCGAVDEAGHPPSERTAFRIASCTKSFTAAAALVVRRAGGLDLDTDIREWLPELRFTGAFAAEPVTVRQLLTMSSGLPEDDPWADRQESMPLEEFELMMAAGVRLASAPGARFRYSNLGYALLGRILERASGTTYRDLVTGSLLRPLGLSDTAFTAEELTVPVVRGYRRAPDGWQPLPFSGPGGFSPIGGLFSTLQDLRHWAQWLAAGAASADPSAAGTLSGGPLDVAERAEMQQIQQPMPLRPQDPPGTRRGYGFGLNVLEHPAAGRIVFHSGGYPGFSSQMRWHPASGTVALGLENATYSRVGEAVTQALETAVGLSPACPAGPPVLAVAEEQCDAETWPELQEVRTALGAWLSDPTQAAERDLRARFSPTMDQDQPWGERRAEWLRLRAAAGPLRPDEVRPDGGDAPAEIRWIVPGEHADLACLAQLTPVEPPLVQKLEITAADGA
ncbi:beta-lactamase family protein [Arthrobacter gandavensis]|uniref:serine hydrolase domain-containing protein n=1 Tax=Arthrobacter gandavensis TaxID=169960 RepID=UPI0018906D18|nr:serine hydrolase domain-containing protein [Arthrobacter gandavensis]MBF4993297.1 beta-lactamase family protein [Arthrobacter gandavensis]